MTVYWIVVLTRSWQRTVVMLLKESHGCISLFLIHFQKCIRLEQQIILLGNAIVQTICTSRYNIQ